MITQRQYIKSESPVSLGASHYCSLGRRSSTTSSSLATTAGEMPMKLEERLNELESNAVKALLSLGEVFVSQSPYRAPPPVKKQPEPYAYTRPLQPHHQQQHHHHNHQQSHYQPARSVIVKAEPVAHDERRNQNQCQQQQSQRSPTISSTTTPGQNHYVRELSSSSSNNGLTFNNQTTIKFTPATTVGSTVGSSNNITSPVSIQPVVSAVSSSSPMISTIFYQIPASSVTSHGTTTGTAVMSPSFTIIPAHNGPRAMIPLPINTPLVKLEPGTGGGQNTVNWNNIQLVKVPRTSIDSNGVTTFSTLAPATALTTSTLLPSPGKGDGGGKSSLVTGADGKSPTKSRARRRSQSTTKGQSRGSSRVSSGSSDIVIPSSVEGLPNIVVDGYEITREIWAKAFLQNDIIHAAGTLFNALFSSEEIKNCTLNGRNGTRQLCPEKRHAIFRIVAWMKNKCQDPYSFNTSPEDTKILNREEQMMIEKKVFVERRYQTSRKIRDLPPTPQLPSALPTLSSIITPSSTTTTSSTTPKKNAIPERRDSGSFSSVCSIGDEKGIPKIALIQSSEIIANYFQNAEPLSTTSVPTPASSLLHHDVGPPPMKMQKVG